MWEQTVCPIWQLPSGGCRYINIVDFIERLDPFILILTVVENWQEFVSAVLTGDTAVLLNGSQSK